jgi:hypothetical protein
MEIKVTQDHIDAARFMEDVSNCEGGYISSCQRCPIALALKSQGFPDADVGKNFAYLRGTDKRHVMLPVKIRMFIHAYDNKQPVDPISFRYENGRLYGVRPL